MTDEHPRKIETMECSSIVHSVAEGLQALTARVAKTETAISFTRSELESLRDVLRLLPLNNHPIHEPSGEIRPIQDGDMFGVATKHPYNILVSSKDDVPSLEHSFGCH